MQACCPLHNLTEKRTCTGFMVSLCSTRVVEQEGWSGYKAERLLPYLISDGGIRGCLCCQGPGKGEHRSGAALMMVARICSSNAQVRVRVCVGLCVQMCERILIAVLTAVM